MAIYEVEDENGLVLELEGDTEPTESDLEEIFAEARRNPQLYTFEPAPSPTNALPEVTPVVSQEESRQFIPKPKTEQLLPIETPVETTPEAAKTLAKTKEIGAVPGKAKEGAGRPFPRTSQERLDAGMDDPIDRFREDMAFRVKDAWSEGDKQAIKTEAVYDIMVRGGGKDEINEWKNNNLELVPSNVDDSDDNFFEKAVSGTVGMLPTIARGMHEGQKLGLVGAGTGAAIGLAGGPASPITAPAGAAAGYAFGSGVGATDYWRRQGTVEVFEMMLDEGVDKNIASKVAIVAGFPYALLEKLQVSKFVKGLPEPVKKSMKNVLLKNIVKAFTSQGVNVVEETFTEGLQKAVAVTAGEIGKNIDDNVTDPKLLESAKKVVSATGQEMIAALPSMVGMTLPGGIRGVKQAVQQTNQQNKIQHKIQQNIEEFNQKNTWVNAELVNGEIKLSPKPGLSPDMQNAPDITKDETSFDEDQNAPDITEDEIPLEEDPDANGQPVGETDTPPLASAPKKAQESASTAQGRTLEKLGITNYNNLPESVQKEIWTLLSADERKRILTTEESASQEQIPENKSAEDTGLISQEEALSPVAEVQQSADLPEVETVAEPVKESNTALKEEVKQPEVATFKSDVLTNEPPQQPAKTAEVIEEPQIAEIPVVHINKPDISEQIAVQPVADPTPDQAEDGNYKKAHIKLDGLDISIENPSGSVRKSKNPDNPWEIEMKDHYGDILGTTGADGDPVDVFINPDDNNRTNKIFIIDQVNPETGKFDEHKVMIGYDSKEQATKAYQRNYAQDWKGLGAINEIKQDSFKGWLRIGKKDKPFGKIIEEKKTVQTEEFSEKDGEDPKLIAERKELLSKSPKSMTEAANKPTKEELSSMVVTIMNKNLGKDDKHYDAITGNRIADNVMDAADNKKYGELASILHLGNPASRAIFEKYTSIKLPKTEKGTKEVIRKFVGEEVHQKHVSDKKAEAEANEKKFNEERKKRTTANLEQLKVNYDGKILPFKKFVETLIENGYTNVETNKKGAIPSYRITKPDGSWVRIRNKAELEYIEDMLVPVREKIRAESEAEDAAIEASYTPEDKDIIDRLFDKDKKPAQTLAQEVEKDYTSKEEVKEVENGRDNELSNKVTETSTGDVEDTESTISEEPGKGLPLANDEDRAASKGTADQYDSTGILRVGNTGSVEQYNGASEGDGIDGGAGGRVVDPDDHVTGAASAIAPESSNFQITAEDKIGVGTPVQKYDANIKAIRLLKELQKENRLATKEEQATLAKFTGWGWAQHLFKPAEKLKKDAPWMRRQQELQSLITDAEYKEARASTINAHYTSPLVVQAMWDKLSQMGFTVGRVLEPGCGIGNFLGLCPSSSNITAMGIEKDSITGQLAKYIYPSFEIVNEAMENVPFEREMFSAVIGNVPFADISIFDENAKQYFGQKIKPNLHDFIILKSLYALQDGGVLSVITSAGTMDKQSEKVRKMMAAKADFLGAVRLPSNAFEGNAGTSVVTDIVFMQKRAEGKEPSALTKTFIETGVVKINDTDITINKYYLENPNQVVGKFDLGGLYSKDQMTVIYSGTDFSGDLQRALNGLPNGIYSQATIDRSIALAQSLAEINVPKENINDLIGEDADSIPSDVYTIGKDGKIYSKNNVGTWEEYDTRERITETMLKNDPTLIEQGYELGMVSPAGEKGAKFYRADSTVRKIKGLIKLRNQRITLLKLESDTKATDKEIEQARKKLNEIYDSFVKEENPVNHRDNVNAIEDDRYAGLIWGLESDYQKGEGKGDKGKAVKADIFRKRINQPFKKIEKADTAEEGLLIALSETGTPDIGRIAELTGRTIDSVVDDLVRSGALFKNPIESEGTNKYELADIYLSGNVRLKLEQAKSAAALNPEFIGNVAALEAVQPKWLTLDDDVYLPIGSPVIPEDTIIRFIANQLGVSTERISNNITKNPKNNSWTINEKYMRLSQEAIKNNEEVWGTPYLSFLDLMSMALNSKQAGIVVKENIIDGTGKKVSVIDVAKTEQAKAKLKDNEKAFIEFLKDNKDDGDVAIHNYNMQVNNQIIYVPKAPTSLTFPGLVTTRTPREHQRNAIWRIIQGAIHKTNTLLAHVVGAGKTVEMLAGVMELKRLGLRKKAMMVVPNHLSQQTAKEIALAYPGARVLLATETNMNKKSRARFLGRVQTGDWDFVVVRQSQFVKIPPNPEAQIARTEQLIAEMLHTIKGSDKNDNSSVKQMEKKIDKLQQKLNGLHAIKRDYTLFWEDMGIDLLVVDEADMYKNLFFTTNQKVLGLGSKDGAEKTEDLYIKIEGLRKKYGSGGVIFATGTPISNTVAEAYHMMKYLQPESLEEMGIKTFDDFSNMYATARTAFELNAAATGYKERTRLISFQNLPELVKQLKKVWDIKTAEDLEEAGILVRGRDLPYLENNKPTSTTIKSNATLEHLKEWLGVMMANLKRPKPGEKGEENTLTILNNGIRAAVDVRLFHWSLPDYPDSKINKLVDMVVKEYKETKEFSGTQQIFYNLTKEDNPFPFNPYQDIKEKLIDAGIPADEIAVITDAKTDDAKGELFRNVNRGKKRIIIGSVQKMGAGTNIQERATAQYWMDPPWRPRDIEQGIGRIVRQGNKMTGGKDNELVIQGLIPETGRKVKVHFLIQEGSAEAFKWQVLMEKAKAIKSVFRSKGDDTIRALDEDDSGYAEAMVQSMGDPLMVQKFTKDRELVAAKAVAEGVRNEILKNQRAIKHADQTLPKYEKLIADVKVEVDAAKPDLSLKEWNNENKTSYEKYEDLGRVVQANITLYAKKNKVNPINVGKVGSYTFDVVYSAAAGGIVVSVKFQGKETAKLSALGLTSKSPQAVAGEFFTYVRGKAAERTLESLEKSKKTLVESSKLAEKRLKKLDVAESDLAVEKVKSELVDIDSRIAEANNKKARLEGFFNTIKNSGESADAAISTLISSNEITPAEADDLRLMIDKSANRPDLNELYVEAKRAKGRQSDGDAVATKQDEQDKEDGIDDDAETVQDSYEYVNEDERLTFSKAVDGAKSYRDFARLFVNINPDLVYINNNGAYHWTKQKVPKIVEVDGYRFYVADFSGTSKIVEPITGVAMFTVEGKTAKKQTEEVKNFFKKHPLDTAILEAVKAKIKDSGISPVYALKNRINKSIRFADSDAAKMEATPTDEAVSVFAQEFAKVAKGLTPEQINKIKVVFLPKSDTKNNFMSINRPGDGTVELLVYKDLPSGREGITRDIQHEIIGHFGFWQLLNDRPDLRNKATFLYKADKNTNGAVYQNLRERYTEEMDIEREVDEWIALNIEQHMAKKETTPSHRRVLEAIKDFIRAALKSVGLASSEENIDDTMKMIYKKVQSGKNVYGKNAETKITEGIMKSVRDDNLRTVNTNTGEFGKENPDIRFSRQEEEQTESDEDMYRRARDIADKGKVDSKSSSRDQSFSSKARELTADIFMPISERLRNISKPLLYGTLRKYEYDYGQAIYTDTKRILPWLEGYSKMSKGDKYVLDLALKNGDKDKINEITEKYKLTDAWKDVRLFLDEKRAELNDEDFDVGYLSDYFPRQIIDSDGLLQAIGNDEAYRGAVELAIARAEETTGRPLTKTEMASIADSVMRNEVPELRQSKFMKERSIKKITPELDKFYSDAPTAILNYIHNMNKALYTRKLFGISENKGFSTNPNIIDIDRSVGQFVLDAVADGKLNKKDQDDLMGILKARLNYKPTDGVVKVIKDLGYLTSMGSGFSAAVTQIGDLAWSFFKNPIYTIPELSKALAKTVTLGKYNPKNITKEDLGVDRIAEEFQTGKGLSRIVAKVFQVTFLTKMDAIGKETLINASLKHYQDMAKKGNKKLTTELEDIFGIEAEQTLQDLKDGNVSPNVKYLLFNRLMDFQPAALSEMPLQYLKSPNGRILYMLKTFTLKQLEVFRREGISKARNPETRKEGIKNLLLLSGLLMILGMAADEIKDWIFDRKTATMSDKVLDNLLKLIGLSRYFTWIVRRESLSGAVIKLIKPPTDIIEKPLNDIEKLSEAVKKGDPIKIKNFESWGLIPVVGKHYDWWFGASREKEMKRRDKNGDAEIILREARTADRELRGLLSSKKSSDRSSAAVYVKKNKDLIVFYRSKLEPLDRRLSKLKELKKKTDKKSLLFQIDAEIEKTREAIQRLAKERK